MAGFVGTNRDRTIHADQRLIIPGRQGLFHQRHAQPHQMWGKISVNLSRPALVGVYNDLRIGRTRTHGLKPGHVIGRAQLDLQQRPMRIGCRLRLHRFRRVQRQGICGDLRTRNRQTRQFPRPFASALGFKVPQRAIHRVACGACGQQIHQTVARKLSRQPGNLSLNRRQRFIIARIRHTFAPALMRPIRHPHRQHLRLGPRPTRDREHLRQPKHIPRDVNPHATTPSSFPKYSRRRPRFFVEKSHPPPAVFLDQSAASASTSLPDPNRNGSVADRPISASSADR